MTTHLIRKHAHRRGISLVSTMIGVTLVTLLLVTNAATLIYAARSARVMSYRMATRNVIQGILERMYAYPYDQVTQANYDTWVANDSSVRVIDGVNNLMCNLTIEIEDEHQVSSGSTSSVTVTGAGWDINRWQGDTVFITAGPGRGQRALILSNTADTLTTQLIGFGQPQWVVQPTAASRILINGGKTVRVTASFDLQGQTYNEAVEGLVVRDD